MRIQFRLTSLVFTLFLITACQSAQTESAQETPAIQPTGAIETPAQPTAEPAILTPPAKDHQAEDEMLDVDQILLEIDQDACEVALEMHAELQLLKDQGQDVTELEEAIIELVDEIENCRP